MTLHRISMPCHFVSMCASRIAWVCINLSPSLSCYSQPTPHHQFLPPLCTMTLSRASLRSSYSCPWKSCCRS